MTFGQHLKILTISVPERTTLAPLIRHKFHPPALVCCLVNQSWCHARDRGVEEMYHPVCNCTQQCIRIALGCQRGLILCSVVHKCWFSIVPTRCQDCAVLCQRGLVLCSVVPMRFSIVQCCAQVLVEYCANEVPRLYSVVPTRFGIV